MFPASPERNGIVSLTAERRAGHIAKYNHGGTGVGHTSTAAYDASGAKDKLKRLPTKAKESEIVEWLTR